MNERRIATVCVIFLVITLSVTLLLPHSAPGLEPVTGPPDIEVFVREGCPHCALAKEFLDELVRERPTLRIVIRDVSRDSESLARLTLLAAQHHAAAIGVPAFLISNEFQVGFDDRATTGAWIRSRLDHQLATTEAPNKDRVQVPWFGQIRARDVGLPLFTIAVGLLDGFNPCAMWVLLFLLSLLVNLHDRWKMALIAGTFVFISGLLYFAFMAAWLNLFLVVGLSRPIQIGLAGLAGVIGLVNIKDFFAFRQGPTVSIPESAKPGLYARVRRILQAENLTGALIGIVLLAGLVNLVEFLCTAGFPALYTQILTLRNLPTWEYYGYLGLYNLAYMLDDSIMVAVAVITFTRFKLQERGGQWLKLISGVVMVGLGAVLLLQPEWLI